MFSRRTLLSTLALVPLGATAWSQTTRNSAADKSSSPPLPVYRIEAEPFEASEADIRAVLDSAARQLWPYFEGYKLEPIVVRRGKSGPITLYRRNEKKEIVLQLDTSGTYWSQYAYQFAHELCHVLCGYREQDAANRWFEETLCETASLFALRGMARQWRDQPPYAHWANYRDSLRGYVDDIINGRSELKSLYARGVAAFYREHEKTLRTTPTERNLNGTLAVVFLHLLESEPAAWGAVRWLNHTPAPEGESLAGYLKRWHDAAPTKHQTFIASVAKLFDVVG